MKVAPWHRGHRVRFLNLTSGTLRCALGVRDRHFDATPGWWQMDLQARTSPLLGCTLFRVAVPAGWVCNDREATPPNLQPVDLRTATILTWMSGGSGTPAMGLFASPIG
jgi:hypothetical protein